MAEKTDWLLISDIKSKNTENLHRICKALKSNSINCSERIIPQIYHPKELAAIKHFNFQHIIFTIYRFWNKSAQVVDFVKKNREITAVTMPAEAFNKSFNNQLKVLGVQTFVHTINDKALAKNFFDLGVDGIYSANHFNDFE